MIDQQVSDELAKDFARGLVRRLTERAVGSDEASRRLVNIQPADHILAGFLTPAEVMPPEDEAADLPEDSDYEQSSIGFEWLAPTGLSDVRLVVQMDLSIYVRVLPTREEQERYGRWDRVDRHDPKSARQAALVPVWERVELPRIETTIVVDTLGPGRKARIDLHDSIAAAAGAAIGEIAHRFPGRVTMHVPQARFSSYEEWMGSLPTPAADLPWASELDARATRDSSSADTVRLSLRLVNRTDVPRVSRAFVDPNLYGVHVSVTMPAAAHQYGFFREVDDSYRYDLRLAAVGLNCHAGGRAIDDSYRIDTDVVPVAELPRLLPRDIPDALPSFSDLADQPAPILARIADAMQLYDADVWQSTLSGLSGSDYQEALLDRGRFQRDEIEAFSRGVALLADPRYPSVLRAFRLMNETMGKMASSQRRPYSTWRLFQLVFIVKTLPALAAREFPELATNEDQAVDVLWFAAGGGKTEAFLGLIVWQAFFDRIRGKTLGTTALVRFPLRLLAFQQLRRTARTLAQAELIRIREKLGGARFSLGYFVGGTQTPNRIDEELHARFQSSGVPVKEAKLLKCPFCDSPVRLEYDPRLRLLEHCCTNGSCPGGSERLPLYVVDYDVYQYLPTVIISTVDKLAQFGQQQRFANIFGRVTLICGKHGASYLDTNRQSCGAAAHFAAGGGEPLTACDGARVLYGPFKDLAPALLVQDELHLMSEELGTFDAHYETAVMRLAESLGSQPWKVIAATATIARFEHHAYHLYLKSSRQFPAPGPQAYESFYYRLDRDQVGRLFVGVLGVGRKHTPAVTKTLSLVYQELQEARNAADKSLADFAQRYGLVGSVTKPLADALLYYYELVLTYVLTRKGSDQVAEAIESRVKRELADMYGTDVDQLQIETFNGSVDMADMIAAMEEIEGANPDLPPSERVRGLVTTNIIGHGVDIDRFNWIVFAGFTRLVAEYIQASARVGRTLPGIAIFVTTPQSERDRSVYQRFAKFHEYLDRLVDPSAINRWPLAALHRTLPGLLAGYLMGVAAPECKRRLESVEKVLRSIGSDGTKALQAEEVAAWMLSALGADMAPSPALYQRTADSVSRNLYARVIDSPPSHDPRPRLLSRYLDAMRSLRDVDDPAYIGTETDAETLILKRLIRG